MVESFSGYKNLCVAAAYYSIREYFEEEKEQALASAEDRPLSSPDSSLDLRPLRMDDFKRICEQGSASVGDIKELEEWNNIYGEGGSREPPCVSYIF
ncbi:hypothetical protein OROMI_011831 [Orobanche minor]